MKKFKGEINGREYTDQKQFEEDYKRILEESLNNGRTSFSVNYSIEDVESVGDEGNQQSKTHSAATTGTKPKTLSEAREAKKQLDITDEELEDLCNSIEKIRDLVNRASQDIQEAIDKDQIDHRTQMSIGEVLGSCITAIRWIIQNMPAAARQLVCSELHGATQEMVDKIISELSDRMYEETKRQSCVDSSRDAAQAELDKLDDKIAELEEKYDSLMDEIDSLDDEFNSAGRKISVIQDATGFFNDLLEAFSI